MILCSITTNVLRIYLILSMCACFVCSVLELMKGSCCDSNYKDVNIFNTVILPNKFNCCSICLQFFKKFYGISYFIS
ncbi:hypothetical protein CIPAW_15G178100 [Carya illinoinensis]|uniref:Uncharacterized protein n=1 Tax=Carya illinoinensis TaxID=32201 RepID=A0A8T1NEN7_CARIL|nr:hypothetical protein CIPAW_15G178100 [Carya illinoinensis]